VSGELLTVRVDWWLTTPAGTRALGHNEVTTAGVQDLAAVLSGTGGTALDAAHAYVGVGDSNAAFAAGQTDLQAATNKTRVPMDAGFPSRAGAVVTYRGTFLGDQANHAWAEYGIFWAASGAGTMFSRRVQALGTKPQGQAWQLTATLTLA
jgi:hypothetical protein